MEEAEVRGNQQFYKEQTRWDMKGHKIPGTSTWLPNEIHLFKRLYALIHRYP